MAGGLAVAAVGYWMLTRVGTHSGFALFAVATVVFSLGVSPVFTLTNDLIIGSAPPERAGAASGISETCAEFGGALSIAVFGSIGVAVYRGVLANALPAGLSPEVTKAAMATLGGAVAAARQLPSEVGTALVDTAREAFLRGLRLIAAISAVGSLALAIFAARAFRHVRPASGRTAESAPEVPAAVDDRAMI